MSQKNAVLLESNNKQIFIAQMLRGFFFSVIIFYNRWKQRCLGSGPPDSLWHPVLCCKVEWKENPSCVGRKQAITYRFEHGQQVGQTRRKTKLISDEAVCLQSAALMHDKWREKVRILFQLRPAAIKFLDRMEVIRETFCQ